MQKKLLTLTPELIAAIDHARGDQPFSTFVESMLWRCKPVKESGIVKPVRDADGRGKWQRSVLVK